MLNIKHMSKVLVKAISNLSRTKTQLKNLDCRFSHVKPLDTSIPNNFQ